MPRPESVVDGDHLAEVEASLIGVDGGAGVGRGVRVGVGVDVASGSVVTFTTGTVQIPQLSVPLQAWMRHL